MVDFLEEERAEETEHYCPQCWRMLPPDVEICPVCHAIAVTELPDRTSPFLVLASVAAGGVAVLSLMAVGFSFPMAFLKMGQLGSPSFDGEATIAFAAIAVFNTIGLILGATVASHTMGKTKSRSTIVLGVALPFIGLFDLTAADLPSVRAYGFNYPLTLLFGIPMTILSLLSLILIVLKTKEFKERAPSKPRKPAKPSAENPRQD